MKKLIMALTVATVFTACGDNSTKTDVDVKSDSTMTDSSSMMNSAPPAMTDTTSTMSTAPADTSSSDSSHLKTDAPK